MRLLNADVILSATDLSGFLSCRRKTALDHAAARGEIDRPPRQDDSLLQLLRERGQMHERRFVDNERAAGHGIIDLTDIAIDDRVAATLDAMRQGVARIVQAALEYPAGHRAIEPADTRWFGYADVLRRVEKPSPRFGAWSYEALDTKLSRETKGATILQLALYSDMLAGIQDAPPEFFHVVTPVAEERYRFGDYAPYFRLMQSGIRGFVRAAVTPYPERVPHCDVCDWQTSCDTLMRADDHLSFVAGLGRRHVKELAVHGVTTLRSLASEPLPLRFIPSRGSKATYERLREQARLQLQQRESGRLAVEFLETRPEFGLGALPVPRTGDLFLDLEGDPFGRPDAGTGTGEGNREYLFGLGRIGNALEYTGRWAMNDAEERAAFEATVDDIIAALEADPDVHVYHYAPYEPSAFKRLMGRYATREAEIDRLLRGRRFIDLYAIVRHALRIGAEGYSIKDLEPYFAFVRDVDLHQAGDQRRVVERAIETADVAAITSEVRAAVEGYNRDDVRSTVELRNWLEALRAKRIELGCELPRPTVLAGDPPDEIDERAIKVQTVRDRLLSGVPAERKARSAEEQGRYLLAYLLDWHRREDKAEWWEYYRLRELPEAELIDEPRAVAGLSYVGDIETVKKSVVQRFAYPPQEVEIRRGDTLKRQDGSRFAKVVATNRRKRTLDLLVGPKSLGDRPTALFAHDHVPPRIIEDALMDLGERAANALDDVAPLVAGGLPIAADILPASAARALLMREVPRISSGSLTVPAGKVVDYATSVVMDLDRTCLPIQGPPGAGKTYIGARMIEALVARGFKVGVAANGHKVIRNLLSEVKSARVGHKGDDGDTSDAVTSTIAAFEDNGAARSALETGAIDVLGGTAWLWARPEFAGSVHVLFIDEAGQMSLANATAIARAAQSVVLLGDPQQLEQPRKGSHPDGVDVSALDHILGGAETMPPDRGLFLPETFRLAPAICRFTSELFYEGKLTSRPGLEAQRLTHRAAGLYVIDVEHAGNRQASDEEADAIVQLIDSLLEMPARWIDEDGMERPLTAADIRVMAPFNAQVERIREKFEVQSSKFEAPPVGTVDKFQGQTAAVSIYSMATSHPDDAPKGMEFLYSLNRLNVATSRARCEAIIVASPRLFEPDCQTPHRMRLASALVRFRELAR